MKASLLLVVLFFSCWLADAQTSPLNAEDQSPVKVERVFPNPISDHLFIEITSDEYFSSVIVLMDILGNSVQKWEAVGIVPGTQKIRLTLNDLHSGIYLLKIKIGPRVFVNRLRKI